MDSVSRAAQALKRGGFVVIHDGSRRENEADLVFPASSATPAKIRRLRRDAGGLVCLAVDSSTAKRLCLPFAFELLEKSGNPALAGMAGGKMAYGDVPSFSISVNHVSVFTGITDNDRAKTITEFARLVESKGGAREFARNFRSAGHVFLLIGRGIEMRKGHTELSLELARRSGAVPAVVMCEMLAGNGKAASRAAAMKYARRNGFPFIDGAELVGAPGKP